MELVLYHLCNIPEEGS